MSWQASVVSSVYASVGLPSTPLSAADQGQLARRAGSARCPGPERMLGAGRHWGASVSSVSAAWRMCLCGRTTSIGDVRCGRGHSRDAQKTAEEMEKTATKDDEEKTRSSITKSRSLELNDRPQQLLCRYIAHYDAPSPLEVKCLWGRKGRGSGQPQRP